jgi:preprotein translocase subunit SecG
MFRDAAAWGVHRHVRSVVVPSSPRVSVESEPLPVLTAVIVGIHVTVSLMLVLLVLLHSGRGGGLSDMFGGGIGSAAAGSTVVERNLDRITVGTAIVFAFTTLILAIRLQ